MHVDAPRVKTGCAISDQMEMSEILRSSDSAHDSLEVPMHVCTVSVMCMKEKRVLSKM